ncbi:MAG: hypothetical protein KBA38_03020 [Negativicutes bacterium]|jgi:MFS family permease|nr:hypothetical protein [Negativicutes bacterium]
MDVVMLLAAFGGGILGAAWGALPVFIMTGVVAVAGGLLGMAGFTEYSVGYIAFGPFLGPHITFAGGVAAAAYAANKKNNLKSGCDILTPLYSTGDAGTLFVGGVFGVLGAVLAYVFGSVAKIPTDVVAMTVFTLGVVTRFAFGRTGMTGQCEIERQWYTPKGGLVNNILFGLGVGLTVAYVGQLMLGAGMKKELLGLYPVVCFGISAMTLVFAQTGFPIPATHHITLPCAVAFVLTGNVFIATGVAVFNTLYGDVVGKSFNSHCDTHIDPPATVIFTTVLALNLFFG